MSRAWTRREGRGLLHAAELGAGLALLAVAMSARSQELATVAKVNLPEAPAVAVAESSSITPAEPVRSFVRPAAPVRVRVGYLADPVNRLLASAELSVRMADAVTTYRDDGSGQCPTCHELQLLAALARSRSGMLAYSAAVSLGVNLGARVLWDRGHRRLARAVLIADIVGDGSAVVGNVRVFRSGPPAAPLPTAKRVQIVRLKP